MKTAEGVSQSVSGFNRISNSALILMKSDHSAMQGRRGILLLCADMCTLSAVEEQERFMRSQLQLQQGEGSESEEEEDDEGRRDGGGSK